MVPGRCNRVRPGIVPHRRDTLLMRKPRNRIGMKIDRLLVQEYLGQSRWKCQCDCGNVTIVRSGDLGSGNTKSCGCSRGSHKLSQTAEYKILHKMISRCTNDKCAEYSRYGGRGIKVCERWQGEYGIVNFLKDMGKRPSPNHSVDRINNDGNYEPGNCRWATPDVQGTNTSRNRKLEYNGEVLTVSQWAKRCGISFSGMRYRLQFWPLEKALTTPGNNRYETTDKISDGVLRIGGYEPFPLHF